MGSILFNPDGRIGPKAFFQASLILIAVGAALSLLSAVNFAFSILGVLSLFLLYPWAVIWVKRLHDSGRSGWFFVGIVALWVIIGGFISLFLTMVFIGGAQIQTTGQTYDADSMMTAFTAASRATALPGAAASVILGLAFVAIGNAVLKGDPGPNRYGPPPLR